MDNEELENRIEELSNLLKKQSSVVDDLKNKLNTFKVNYERHKHSGYDNTVGLDDTLQLKTESWVNIGNTYRTNVDANVGTASEINRLYLAVGGGEDTNLALSDSTKTTQLTIENQPGTTGAGLSNSSFIYAFRAPVYISSGISITSGESTMTDASQVWTTNELGNAYLNLHDSTGACRETKLIASNTSTVVTINGTFSFTDASSSYNIVMPVYMGAAEFPWRRLYTVSDIRFGMGTSAGADVCYIKHGTGTPEAAVTAQVGSLFLRLDGGANTTLYVKESGTSNTGWVAK